jgi:energy-coupling factor transport system permease protein
VRRRAPLPVIALGVGAIGVLFASDDPWLVGAAALGALGIFFGAARRAPTVYVWAGGISGLGLVLLTPLVRSDGGYTLVRGPEIAAVDTEITAPEVLAGAVAGARVFAVAVLVGALLAQIDTDRLHELVGRLAPRSAMVVALGVRLLPTLERDGAAIAETARARGLALSRGGWLARGSRGASLVTPLVGSALERSLDIAEAMAARGYGGGRLSPMPEPELGRREWATGALGALLIVLCAAVIAGVAASGGAALGTLVALGLGAWSLR